jgi:hypothetical protein
VKERDHFEDLDINGNKMDLQETRRDLAASIFRMKVFSEISQTAPPNPRSSAA